MATATKTSKTSTSSKSASTSSTSKAAVDAAKLAESIHKMRSEYTNPPVDTPIDVDEAASEVNSTDGKATLNIVAAGGGAEVTIKGGSSVVLDRDGILAAQRHFNRLGSSV